MAVLETEVIQVLNQITEVVVTQVVVLEMDLEEQETEMKAIQVVDLDLMITDSVAIHQEGQMAMEVAALMAPAMVLVVEKETMVR